MKHLKSYESKKEKIKNGDYVVALNFAGYDKTKKYLINSVGKVIFKKNAILYTKYIVGYDFPIEISSHTFAFYDDGIRLATTKEIEQYKLEKMTDKYNL